MEYSAPARSGDMASDMGTKQIRIRNQLRSCNEHVVPDGFGQRVANLAVNPAVYSVPLGQVRSNHGHRERRG